MLSVVAGKIGEDLHVDLDRVAALLPLLLDLVEPGPGGLVVAVVADDDVGIYFYSTVPQGFAHVIRPGTLGAVGPFLHDVSDAGTVLAGFD